MKIQKELDLLIFRTFVIWRTEKHRGEWFKIVTGNGETNNANTSDDRTYYYEVFPSNNLELGLWKLSEWWSGDKPNWADTQNEVVRRKRLRLTTVLWTNHSWGKEKIFTNHLIAGRLLFNGSFRRCNTNWISRLQ
jgi:hypothetical protein